MFTWIFLGVGLLLPTVHGLLLAKDRSPGAIGRLYLVYLLPICVGGSGVMAFLGHTMRADEIARSIGWPTGNPFQFEIAAANLAFGVLGLLCIRFRDGFWTATIVGYGIFLEGAACVHIYEIRTAGDWAVNNAGPILYMDIVLPIVLLGLLILARYGRPGVVAGSGSQ